MNAAACRAADDCWFGGIGSRRTRRARGAARSTCTGTGRRCATVYNPQGRGVSDLEAHGGRCFECVLVGRQAESDAPAGARRGRDAGAAPAAPHRQRRRSSTTTSCRRRRRPTDPDPARSPTRAADGAELLALDADGDSCGRPAAARPRARTRRPRAACVERPPRARAPDRRRVRRGRARRRAGDVRRRPTASSTSPPCRAATTAWVAVQPFADRRRTNVEARVARVAGATGAVDRSCTLPASGSGRGSAARVAFTAPNDGWLVTYAGWLFHYDGRRAPGARHRPGVRPAHRLPPERGRRAVRPRRAAGRRLAAVRAAAGRGRATSPPPSRRRRRPSRCPRCSPRIRVKRRGLQLIVTFSVARRARISSSRPQGQAREALAPARRSSPAGGASSLKLSRKKLADAPAARRAKELDAADRRTPRTATPARGTRSRRGPPGEARGSRCASAMIAVAAAIHFGLSAASTGQAGGARRSAPVLGTAGAEPALMGAAPDGAPGEAWGYQLLPPRTPPPVVDGQPLAFAPAGSDARPQLAFLRSHARGPAGRCATCRSTRAATPTAGMTPNSARGRITPARRRPLVGRDSDRPAAEQFTLLDPPARRPLPRRAGPAADGAAARRGRWRRTAAAGARRSPRTTARASSPRSSARSAAPPRTRSSATTARARPRRAGRASRSICRPPTRRTSGSSPSTRRRARTPGCSARRRVAASCCSAAATAAPARRGGRRPASAPPPSATRRPARPRDRGGRAARGRRRRADGGGRRASGSTVRCERGAASRATSPSSAARGAPDDDDAGATRPRATTRSARASRAGRGYRSIGVRGRRLRRARHHQPAAARRRRDDEPRHATCASTAPRSRACPPAAGNFRASVGVRRRGRGLARGPGRRSRPGCRAGPPDPLARRAPRAAHRGGRRARRRRPARSTPARWPSAARARSPASRPARAGSASSC